LREIRNQQRFKYAEQKSFVKHLGAWYNKKWGEGRERYLEANRNDTVEKIMSTYEQN
jgi:hypothetical protein